MFTPSLVQLWLLAFAPAAATGATGAPPAPPPAVAAPTASSASTVPVGVDTLAEPEETDPIGEALRPDPQGLTADKVVQRALEVSPQVEISNAQVEAAAARVDQTIVAYIPRLSASASYTRLSDVRVRFGSGALVGAANSGLLTSGPCPQDPQTTCILDGGGVPVGAATFTIPQVLNQFSTQASLSIPISDYVFRIFSGLLAARKSEDSAKLSLEAQKRKVAIDARVAYYNWLRAVTQVAVARDAIRTAEARLRDAELGFQVGTVTKADLLRLEALVAQARRVLTNGQAFELVAREQLSVLMNEPTREYTVGEDVLTAEPRIPDVPELDVLVQQAFVQRKELESLGMNTDALRAGIKSEYAGYAPRLEAFGDVIYANPNPRFFPPTNAWNATWQVGARLSWSINQPLTSRMRVKELKAEERNLVAQRVSLERGIRMEVASAYADHQKAIADLSLARINREANEAAYLVVSAQFKAGRATATDVIIIQQDRVSAQLQDINARIDLRVARDKLNYAIGNEG